MSELYDGRRVGLIVRSPFELESITYQLHQQIEDKDVVEQILNSEHVHNVDKYLTNEIIKDKEEFTVKPEIVQVETTPVKSKGSK